ncbi:MAG: O-antigen ligase family protein [Acidobacteria bacterium]|nr:O-antigen ligase family protein [Acidobacteriota bacterium]
MANLSALLAVLIPILALPFWFFYFDITPKAAVLLTGVAAGCWLIPAQSGWRALDSKDRRAALLVGLQIVFLSIATATSTHPALSFSGSNWRRFGLVTQLALFVLLLLAILARQSAGLLSRRALRAIAVSGIAIAVYAIAQYFGYDLLLPSAAYHIGEGEWTIVRPPATIGHADYLGCYLLFTVFLGGSLLVREAERRWQWAGAGAAALGGFAIVLSGTRSAILGLLLGASLLAMRRRLPVRRLAALAIAATAIMAAFYYSPWGLKLRGRTRWYMEDPRGGSRLYLWKDSLHMAAERPVTGWGPETFSAQFPQFQSLALAQAYPDFYHESPHNIFLDEAAGKGFPAAACFLGWCALAFAAAWRALGHSRDAPIGAAFIAATFSLQFNAFVLVTAYFYFVTGLFLMRTGDDVTPPSPRPKWQWIAAPALSILFVAFAVKLCIADYLLLQVKSMLEKGDVVQASQTYERARQWQPPGVNSDLYYSRVMHANVRRQPDLLFAVKGWQESVQAAIRATQFGEDPHNAYYYLASLYAGVNDRRDAEESLRGAIRSAPNWFKPHWILAQVLDAGGRRAEAAAEAAAAVERSGGALPEVNETLRKLSSGSQ